MVVNVKDLSVSFGKKEALKEVTLNVEETEVFGLLGPSGAGKTTLIKVLTGQIKADKGEASILGVNSKNITDDVYGKIGMVLDKHGLYERLNVVQNLNMYADIHGVGKKNIKEILDRVGLKKDQKTIVGKLSKGMKQRLSIARAVLHKPKLLFLDEPTSGLDPVTMKGIHDLLIDLKKDGTSIFITTHNMEEATKLCTRVALLNEGKICEMGSPTELSRKYNEENYISIITKNNKEIKLENNAASACEIKQLFLKEEVVSIHSSEPNLESVFIQLTGRRIES